MANRFKVQVPIAAQKALLRLPHVQGYLAARERLLMVETAGRLNTLGLSQNRIAKGLGIASSQLSRLRQLFADGGFAALYPRPGGRVPKVKARPRPGVFVFL